MRTRCLLTGVAILVANLAVENAFAQGQPMTSDKGAATAATSPNGNGSSPGVSSSDQGSGNVAAGTGSHKHRSKHAAVTPRQATQTRNSETGTDAATGAGPSDTPH